MDSKLVKFSLLSDIFKQNGYSLYLVGGTVRDFLLSLPIDDLDVVTDATPEEMKKFIDGNYRYEKMGSVSFKYEGVHFDITTLRKEKRYKDARHPLNVKFVKKLNKDVIRRDFTINGLYMDSSYQLYDFVNGQKDLNNKILKMIGNPNKRLKEDPLRILRAIRFALTYDLIFDKKLKRAMKKNIHQLQRLNQEKIKLDLRKLKGVDKNKIINLFDEFSIKHLLNVVNC